jgi:hypothetical protein
VELRKILQNTKQSIQKLQTKEKSLAAFDDWSSKDKSHPPAQGASDHICHLEKLLMSTNLNNLARDVPGQSVCWCTEIKENFLMIYLMSIVYICLQNITLFVSLKK